MSLWLYRISVKTWGWTKAKAGPWLGRKSGFSVVFGIFVFCIALFGFKSLQAIPNVAQNQTFGHVRYIEKTPTHPVQKYKIGLCIVATGKYSELTLGLIESARCYFCTHHNVTYFVFTDTDISKRDDIVKISQSQLGWPFDTLKRFHMYEAHQNLFEKMDYLFAVDADMLFVAPVGDEILADLVGTQHPGFIGKRGTYEKNKKSKAYVAPNEGEHYFCGGFYGGRRDEFLKLLKTTIQQIDKDLAHNFIAKWHDEGHLNRYFIDHPPVKILTPSYCYPESWHLEFPKKIVALNKNHQEMRKSE